MFEEKLNEVMLWLYIPGAEFPILVWPDRVPSIGTDSVVVDGSVLPVCPLHITTLWI